MKNSLFTLLFLIISSSLIADNETKQDYISINCSQDLNKLNKSWADEYSTIHSNTRININNNINGYKESSANTNIFIYSSTNKYPKLKNKNDFSSIIIGRDVIVPIINSNNPLLKDIYLKGITSEKLRELMQNTENSNWDIIIKNNKNLPIKLYINNDETVISTISEYLNIEKTSITNTQIKNINELLIKTQNNPLALSFCRLNDIINSNNKLIENIKILPIDVNNNGKIDYMESIYNNIYDFNRGIYLGKYPKALSKKIYCIYSNKITKNEKEYINWILNEGQHLTSLSGYNTLTLSEKYSNENKIIGSNLITTNSEKNKTDKSIIIILLVIITAGFVLLDIVFRYMRKKGVVNKKKINHTKGILKESNINMPKGIFYDKSHTWAFMEKDGAVKIGIDDFLQRITGPISKIKMIGKGENVKKNDTIFTIIQNGKQLTIKSPISGKIIDSNKILSDNASSINSSPYNDGWIYSIEPSNWIKEIQNLEMVEKYKEWIKTELSRLKDLFTNSINNIKCNTAFVLQDGGELKEGILAEQGPELWEDFQINFLNKSL